MKKGASPSSTPSSPKQYSIKEVRDLFHIIAQYIIENEDLLRQEGVFRLSGTARELPEIADDLLSGIKPNKSQTLNNYIGVLKLALKDNMLIAANDPSLVKLRTAFQDMSRDASSAQNTARAIRDFIGELAESGDENKLYLAEILYTYFHLNKLASQYEDINKMSPNNLAIASTGPFFLNNLPIVPSSDPLAAISMQDKFNLASAKAVESPMFEAPFLLAMIEQNVEARRRQLEHLERQSDALQKMFKQQGEVVNNRAKIIVDEMMQVGRLEKDLQAHQQDKKGKKADKKAYKAETKRLESEIQKLQDHIGQLDRINQDIIVTLKKEQERGRTLRERVGELQSAFREWDERQSHSHSSLSASTDSTPGGSPQSTTPVSSRDTSPSSSPQTPRRQESMVFTRQTSQTSLSSSASSSPRSDRSDSLSHDDKSDKDKKKKKGPS